MALPDRLREEDGSASSEAGARPGCQVPWPRVKVMLAPMESRAFSTRDTAFEMWPPRDDAADMIVVSISLFARAMRSTAAGSS